MKVAFQGTKGAYSQEALYLHYPKETESLGIALSEDVCDALDKDHVDEIILPIENSIVGNVDINMDLIFRYKFHATAEIYLPIRHCLMAHKGAKLNEIKTAHSHPIALAQCHDFLKANNIKSIPEYDTAGACLDLSQNEDFSKASIGSRLCAEFYNLEVLHENVQQVKRNITRFLVFSKKENKEFNKNSAYKTSIAFCTKHHPGALLECLNVFAERKINLTKLESRPIPENPFMYIFFIDFIGHINEEKIRDCFSQLENHASSIQIIGSYERGNLPL